VTTRVYDLTMTHRLDADDLFIHRVQEQCARRRLNFFLIEPVWVEKFYEEFQRGAIWSRVLLNMHSEHHQPEEIYHRVVRLAADRNTRVIDHPDVARAAFDKQLLHPRLMWWGIYVPYTLFVHAKEISKFKLTDEHRAALGKPFVIKPALGYGRQGVVLDAVSEQDLARSYAAWPDGTFLLQRRIVPLRHKGRPAYFRIFYVFGSVWTCWWDCETHHYEMTRPEDGYNFQPVEEIARRIAALTGMQFFSSEIAQSESGQLVAIDYVNDQCHLLSQSADPRIGVPDVLVCAIADRLVQAAQDVIRG
jgi:hypothetical protein